MLLLALDTSAAVGVAVHDGERVLAQQVEDDARRHTELLAPAVRDVLAAAGVHRRDLTGIAVGVGPAPFTGLRVGVVTAMVLGEALGVPVHGLCSLDALAATVLGAVADDPASTAPDAPALDDPARTSAAVGGGAGQELAAGFVAASDARRREVHWARYALTARDAGVSAPDGVPVDPVRGWCRVAGPSVAAPGAVERAGLPCVGRGAALYADALPGPVGLPQVPAPGWLAAVVADRLRRGGELLPPAPLYLRRPDAAEPGAPKRVTV